MLEAHAIDTVDIATPRETHAGLVDIAAEHGIDALCQKPLTPTLAEGRGAGGPRGRRHPPDGARELALPSLVSDARAVARGRRSRSRTSATMTMLSSGLVRDASGRFPDLVRQPFMAHEKRLMIAEVLIHHIDVVRWLLGPLRLVAARTAHTVPEVAGETLATIFLETAAGAPVIVGGALAAPGLLPGRVIGSRSSAARQVPC